MKNPKSEILNPKINVGIVGAGGYAGETLLGILLRHPNVKISYVMSEDAHVGKKVSDLYPHLYGEIDLTIEKTKAKKADVVFLALPHGVSQNYVPDILKFGSKVVDLGADYRFAKEAVYGLPELFAEKIKKTKLVGNPGCYPTATILGVYPLIKEGLIEKNIIVDAKSGVSGAGRGLNQATHFPETNEGIAAYKVAEHRHTAEMEVYTGCKVTFVPHLTPMNRGILATIYVKTVKSVSSVISVYKKFYKNAPFVRILEDKLPNPKYVAGTNYCDIAICQDKKNKQLIILSAIDNLVKGAAGQAVQNMNLMCGFPEKAGLKQIALYP